MTTHLEGCSGVCKLFPHDPLFCLGFTIIIMCYLDKAMCEKENKLLNCRRVQRYDLV